MIFFIHMQKHISKIKKVVANAGLISEEKITLSRVEAGVTNQVYFVMEDSTPKLVARIYGNNLDALIDRDYENELLPYLNKYGIGPKIILNSDEYRIESFIKGATDLSPGSYQAQLATELRRFHNIPILNSNKNFWSRLDGWILKTNPPYQTEFNALSAFLNNDDISAEINKTLHLNEIVLGHGDLCLDNIMVSEDLNINLIDFEYSCNMPRAFDIANHLCEYNGLIIKKDSYPDENIRKYFIESYLGDEKKYEDRDLQLVDLYSLISHYQWGCWGLIMKDFNDQFDYDVYAKSRFDLFKHYYETFFMSDSKKIIV